MNQHVALSTLQVSEPSQRQEAQSPRINDKPDTVDSLLVNRRLLMSAVTERVCSKPESLLEPEGPLKDVDVDSVARRARTLRNHMVHLQNRANDRKFESSYSDE